MGPHGCSHCGTASQGAGSAPRYCESKKCATAATQKGATSVAW